MINIFVCEDNNDQREKFTKLINDFIIIQNFDMKIALSTINPYDIIDYLNNNKVLGLYFLDVNLKSTINGIKLAEKIRDFDPLGFIVFVTTHAEMSYLTFIYKVEAMDYIIKDNFSNVQERIQQCIITANKKHSLSTNDCKKNFSIKINDKIINVEYNKILFFETSTIIHKVILHATDRQIQFYSQIKEVEDKLDNRFYRCHRSFLVNKDNIKEIDLRSRVVSMVNGETCLVSTRLLKGLVT